MSGILGKKPVLEQSGEIEKLVSALMQHKDESKGLAGAIIAKLPDVAKDPTKLLTNKIDKDLGKAVKDLKGTA